jgi:undecaprenyl-diphosphatase
LPHLQPLKLTPKTRHAVAERAGLLDELRAELAGATGQEAPPVLRPVSVAARNLLPLVGALFAINLLLPQVGHLDATVTAVRHAQWAWLVVVGMLSALTYLMAAVALRGAANQRLALGRTWAVQVAAAFTNRLTPAGLGGMTTNLRYLEAAGTPRPAAVAAITLDSVAGFLVHTVAIAVLIPLLGAHSPAGVHFSVSELPERWPILLAVVAALVGAGVVVWLSRLHRRVLPPVRVAVAALGATLRHPANAVALFGGSAGVTTCYALALAAAAQAFGLSVGVASVVAVYLGGSAVAAVAPTPGGLGALEASLVAGLTAAGAQAGPAVAAVLAFRLVTFWIPTIPGFLAYRTLHQSGVV